MFDIIVTLNHNSVEQVLLEQFLDAGVTLFRINGSFISTSEIAELVSRVRDRCGKRVGILLDLPGFKPRFSNLNGEIRYRSGVPMRVELGSINYPELVNRLSVGDHIRINDGMVRLRVEEIRDGEIVFIPNRDGILRRGKGFYLETGGYRPARHSLSELDIRLLELAKRSELEYVGLSFVHNMEDIQHVQSYLRGSGTSFIPKIEARESLEHQNLFDILSSGSKVIVDRGDMSGEVGLENVWHYQRRILEVGRVLGCGVIMATQFFLNMMRSPLPSIAETDSFTDLLHFGIQGVQLSEETSVGDHGIEVVRFVSERVREFDVPGAAGHRKKGGVVWILGPTSSGKTTIAKAVTEHLSRSKVPVKHLDGDEIRSLFGPKHAFEAEDRLLVVKSLVHHANKAAESGQNVIVSALTAWEDARQHVRENVKDLTTVYLDCPMEECVRRDPKGLYAKSLRGEIHTVIGLNKEYRPPHEKDITLHTGSGSPAECARELLSFLVREGRIRLWDGH